MSYNENLDRGFPFIFHVPIILNRNLHTHCDCSFEIRHLGRYFIICLKNFGLQRADPKSHILNRTWMISSGLEEWMKFQTSVIADFGLSKDFHQTLLKFHFPIESNKIFVFSQFSRINNATLGVVSLFTLKKLVFWIDNVEHHEW